jgi:hypothetical protein
MIWDGEYLANPVEEYGFEAAAAAGAPVERLGEEAACRLGEMGPRGRRGGEDAMVAACLCWLLCAAPNIFQKSFLWPETLEHQPSADFPPRHFTSPVLKKTIVG